ncbi:GFA family protein [Litorimonas sp. WD9-15]|uniref:GFA family protein n=1 Tax=Litorimonas sp. WD9-15 TaxID=3418716 RepID=UPI003D02725E
MSDITHRGGCHCGAVQFEFDAPAKVDVTDCNCSMCRMTGYEHVFVPQEKLRFLFGDDALTTYTFNTGAAKHKFCNICGIKPLYRPRSHPDAWSVNLRCVEAGTMEVARRIAFDGDDWEGNIAGLRAET